MLGQLRQVVVAVDDLDEAVSLFSGELGLAVKFRDGDRYAALELGGVTLALTGPADRTSADPISLGCKVPDLEAAIADLTHRGWSPEGAVSTSEHERRALLRSPSGTPFVLYQPTG